MTLPPPPPNHPLPPTAPAVGTPPVKKHIAYQLAQLSLYAPFVALALGCLVNSSLKPDDSVSNLKGKTAAALLLVGVNILLLVTSVISGIVALCFLPRLGPKGILIRAATGIVISSLFLAGVGYFVFGASSASTVQKRIAGDWHSTVTAGGSGTAHVQMTLNSDGSARWEIVDGPRPMVFRGQWRVAAPAKFSGDLSLQIRFDAPNPALPNVNGLGWKIERIQDTQLDLVTNDANGNTLHEVYTRKP